MRLSIRLLTGIYFLLLLLCRPAYAAEETLLIMGDSLSAAYGIQTDQGWVSLLEKKLQQQNSSVQVINASVSGETTTGGLQRLPAALDRHQPAWVFIELGANDGLRGGSIDIMRNNLSQMIQLAQQAGAQPVLFEMHLPPNYGATYTRWFRQSYTKLAEQYQIPLMPFFIQDVAGKERYIQPDGLHPTAQAQPLILARVWPMIDQLFND